MGAGLGGTRPALVGRLGSPRCWGGPGCWAVHRGPGGLSVGPLSVALVGAWGLVGGCLVVGGGARRGMGLCWGFQHAGLGVFCGPGRHVQGCCPPECVTAVHHLARRGSVFGGVCPTRAVHRGPVCGLGVGWRPGWKPSPVLGGLGRMVGLSNVGPVGNAVFVVGGAGWGVPGVGAGVVGGGARRGIVGMSGAGLG